MKAIAIVFATWFAIYGLAPTDPSECELMGVYSAGRTHHFWGCYACRVPEHKRLGKKVPHRYLGTILMRCDDKWCDRLLPVPRWSWETAGTCEVEAQK